MTGGIPDAEDIGFMALEKLNNITISEYKKLEPKELACINELADSYILAKRTFYENILYHKIVANIIKNKFNQMHGEGNYVVIPIGRSLSSIGKCLGYKIGEDNVKPLPISKARRFNYPENCKNENYGAFLDYLI